MSKENNLERNQAFLILSEALQREPAITSGRVYGSSLTRTDEKPDVDLAIMVVSDKGVVEGETYARLKEMRHSLCEQTGCDIDLIPHTEDEVLDAGSPLWNPRYYPSLVQGVDVKSIFPLPKAITALQDASAYILHDNRTITRRQLLRVNGTGNWKIFVSKLVHGPGNVLTYLHLHERFPWLANPSETELCFEILDKVQRTDSRGMIERFKQARVRIEEGTFTFEEGVVLMNWYEDLLRRTFREGET